MNFNNASEKKRTEERFRLTFFLLRLGGIPLCMKEVKGFYFAYSVFAVVCFYINYAGSSLDVAVNLHEREHPMYSVRLWYGFSLLGFIHISISVYKCKIEKLIRFTESFTWEDLPTRDPESGQLTQAGLLKIIKKVIKYVFISITIFHFIQTSFRLITEGGTILNAWFPFDIDSSPNYELLLIAQIIASIVTMALLCGFMDLYPTMVIIACSQLQKLKGKLLEIKITYLPSDHIIDDKSKEDENYDRIDKSKENVLLMHYTLKECIEFHQEILEYTKMVEESFNFILGGLLLHNLGALCIYAFSSVTNWGDTADVSQGVVGYVLLTLNLFILCATGAELTKEVQSVREVVFDCDWIGAPIPFQRSVLFMIARANKEFTLTAAKFVPVSMVTFMNIMQQTLSYFMFLLEMKDRNKDA